PFSVVAEVRTGLSSSSYPTPETCVAWAAQATLFSEAA
ncbi:MAG: hypothetical protein RIQ79_2222, partial [Verrucomicrobiota bacterium]